MHWHRKSPGVQECVTKAHGKRRHFKDTCSKVQKDLKKGFAPEQRIRRDRDMMATGVEIRDRYIGNRN